MALIDMGNTLAAETPFEQGRLTGLDVWTEEMHLDPSSKDYQAACAVAFLKAGYRSGRLNLDEADFLRFHAGVLRGMLEAHQSFVA